MVVDITAADSSHALHSSKVEDVQKKKTNTSMPTSPSRMNSPTPDVTVTEDEMGEGMEDERIVPQLRIGTDGKIIIDEGRLAN